MTFRKTARDRFLESQANTSVLYPCPRGGWCKTEKACQAADKCQIPFVKTTKARSAKRVHGGALSITGVPPSELEEIFAQQLRALHLPRPERQYPPIPERLFRIDFAWPVWKLGVEIDGAVHRIKQRYEGDITRNWLIMMADWKVLHLDGRAVRSGRGIDMAHAFLLRFGPQFQHKPVLEIARHLAAGSPWV